MVKPHITQRKLFYLLLLPSSLLALSWFLYIVIHYGGHLPSTVY
jgi:hypothetical protein